MFLNRRGNANDRAFYMAVCNLKLKDDQKTLFNFLKTTIEFLEDKLDVCEACLKIASIIRKYPKMIEGFNRFLPMGYLIGLGQKGHVFLQVPATAVLPEYKTEAEKNNVCLRQNYITLLPAVYSNLQISGLNLKCNRHPSALFYTDLMCSGCYHKTFMRRNFEDFKNFFFQVKSQLKQCMFDMFVKTLRAYQTGRLPITKIQPYMGHVFKEDVSLYYEFFSFLTDIRSILTDERVKDCVDSFIPVAIETVEVVICSDSNVTSDELEVNAHGVNVPTQVQQNLTNASEPRRSARLLNAISNEFNNVQQSIPCSSTQTATKISPKNKIPNTDVRRQNRRMVRLHETYKTRSSVKCGKTKENSVSHCNQQHNKKSKTKKLVGQSNESITLRYNPLLRNSPTRDIEQIVKNVNLQNLFQPEPVDSTRNSQATQPQRNIKPRRSKKQRPNSSIRNVPSSRKKAAAIKKKYKISSKVHPSLNKKSTISSRARHSTILQSRSTRGRRFPKQQTSSTKACNSDKQQSSSAIVRHSGKQQSSSTRDRRTADKQQSNKILGGISVGEPCTSSKSRRPASQRSTTTSRGRNSVGQQILTRRRCSVSKQSSNTIKNCISANQIPTNSTNFAQSTSEKPLNLNRDRLIVRRANFRSCRSVSQEPTSATRPLLSVNPEPTSATRPLRSVNPEPTSSRNPRRSVSHEPTSSRKPLLSVNPEPTSSRKPRLSVSHEPTSSRKLRRSVSHEPTNSRKRSLTVSHEPTSSSKPCRTNSYEPRSLRKPRRSVSHEPKSSRKPHRTDSPEPTSSTRPRGSVSHEPTSSTELRRSVNRERISLTRPRRSVSHEPLRSTRSRQPEKQTTTDTEDVDL